MMRAIGCSPRLRSISAFIAVLDLEARRQRAVLPDDSTVFLPALGWGPGGAQRSGVAPASNTPNRGRGPWQRNPWPAWLVWGGASLIIARRIARIELHGAISHGGMAFSKSYRDFVVEQLERIAPVTAKPMFDGE